MRGPITVPWGKLHRPEGEDAQWHPLSHHCFDVAAVLIALLERTLLRQRLAAFGDLDDLSQPQIWRLGWLAYLHDVGKLNSGFQGRAHGGPPVGHVKEAQGLFDPLNKCVFRPSLRFDAAAGWMDGGIQTLWTLLGAAIAHHGRPLTNLGRITGSLLDQWRPKGDYDPMKALAEFAAVGAAALAPAFEETAAPLPAAPPFSHAFAGLMTLADWIGSDREVFPYSRSLDEDRFPWALDRAREAVGHFGLKPATARAATPLRDHLRSIGLTKPRPMQQVVADLPLPEPGQASTVIVESDTGSGKTEAAVAHFLRLFAAGLVDGLYFALPTRAAAVQIHQRIYEALKNALGEAAVPPVVLAVPGYLRVDETDGRHLPDFGVLWPDQGDKRRYGHTWAAENPKRFLAAAVAVGTVDQALLAALQTRHSHLRATSLSRLLLVVDEVHASDPYMSALLGWILDRFAQAKGHALLMSATLGGAAKARWLWTPTPTRAEAEAALYPLITMQTGDRIDTIRCPSHGKPKRVRMEPLPLWDAAQASGVAARALAAAQAGARVLIIRNTVKDAIKTQEALEAAAPPDSGLLFRCNGVAALHHSRFAAADRKRLDARVEEVFGPPAFATRAARTGGVALVATQTVEQSLDIDADLLITDLCPADVLLQRIGRLHRHELARPAGYEQPHVVLLTPAERDLAPLAAKGSSAMGFVKGEPRAYPDVRVIEATWGLVEAHPVWDLPTMNRKLVEGATHPAVLQAIAEGGNPSWAAHAQSVEGKTSAERGLARLNMVCWDEPFGEVEFPDDVKLSSRLGESDRLIAFTDPPRSPFDLDAPLDRLSAPHWMVRGISPDAEPQKTAEAPLRFSLDTAEFLYDRFGLQRTKWD